MIKNKGDKSRVTEWQKALSLSIIDRKRGGALLMEVEGVDAAESNGRARPPNNRYMRSKWPPGPPPTGIPARHSDPLPRPLSRCLHTTNPTTQPPMALHVCLPKLFSSGTTRQNLHPTRSWNSAALLPPAICLGLCVFP